MRRKRHHRPTRCVGRDVAAPVYRGGVARVVELADTGGLNPPGSKEAVRVQVPPRAPSTEKLLPLNLWKY